MRSICAIDGVEAAGIREGKYGLALIRRRGDRCRRLHLEPGPGGSHRV